MSADFCASSCNTGVSGQYWWILVYLVILFASPQVALNAHPPVDIAGSNVSDALLQCNFTVLLLFNQYCSDCRRLQHQFCAAAQAYDGPEQAARFAQADTTTDKSLLRVFGVSQVPVILVYRSSDSAWWPYTGELSHRAISSQVSALASAAPFEWHEVLSAAEADDMAADGLSIAIFASAPESHDGVAHKVQLFQNVSDAPCVRQAAPGGVTVGVLTADSRPYFKLHSHRPDNLTLLAKFGDNHLVQWQGTEWPTVDEAEKWLVKHATTPTLLELTPHSMSDAVLDAAREKNQSLLVIFCSMSSRCPGQGYDGTWGQEMMHLVTSYSSSLRVCWLDESVWPELAFRLRGPSTSHDMLIIDVRGTVVLVDPTPRTAAEIQLVQSKESLLASARRFCERFLNGELRSLALLGPKLLYSGRQSATQQQVLLRGNFQTAGPDSRSGVRNLFASDFCAPLDPIRPCTGEDGWILNSNRVAIVAFLLPWCVFSMQLEPLLDELFLVASMAEVPVDVGIFHVSPTNSIPEHLAKTVPVLDALPQVILFQPRSNAAEINMAADSPSPVHMDRGLPTVYEGPLSTPLLLAFVVQQMHAHRQVSVSLRLDCVS